MPTVIGHHDITKDSKHWLSSPKRKELFGSLGITNIRTFVDPQNPKRVAVMMDVPDMDKMAALMQAEAGGDKPILLRVEGKAGHGAGKPISKRIEEATDVYSFLFWQLGVTPPS